MQTMTCHENQTQNHHHIEIKKDQKGIFLNLETKITGLEK